MDEINLPTNIYYDANIINSDQSGIKPPPRLIFQDIRSIPILSSPESYRYQLFVSIYKPQTHCQYSYQIYKLIHIIQIKQHTHLH